jgi:hypothetical protein
MNVFLPRLLASLFALAPLTASSADDPVIGGPLVDLRKAPTFMAASIPMAKTWGVAPPVGTVFQVEKVYGRWIYGQPEPLPHMRAADFSPPGWVFSRALLLPGDADTLPSGVIAQGRSLLYHARATWKKLGWESDGLEFLEGLVLSKRTLAAFSISETPAPNAGVKIIPEAFASESAPPAPLGLTGTDFSFLDQEVKVVRNRHALETRVRDSKHVRVPATPSIDDRTRTALLGRYMLERYLELPPLSMEEVDGHVYMRATAMRALEGCSAKVKNYWKDRRWGYFRVYRLKSRPELKHPWFEVSLPGGYFALSGRAIELAADEAELAFVLARQLVRETRIKRPPVHFAKQSWPETLSAKAEQLWDQALKTQSTKDSAGFDVADEIAVDQEAIACIANAGYRPMSAIAYLRKLAFNKDQPWAAWYEKHAIGLDYRIERLTTLTQDAVAQQQIPDGKDARAKRFASAVKQWNILP